METMMGSKISSKKHYAKSIYSQQRSWEIIRVLMLQGFGHIGVSLDWTMQNSCIYGCNRNLLAKYVKVYVGLKYKKKMLLTVRTWWYYPLFLFNVKKKKKKRKENKIVKIFMKTQHWKNSAC